MGLWEERLALEGTGPVLLLASYFSLGCDRARPHPQGRLHSHSISSSSPMTAWEILLFQCRLFLSYHCFLLIVLCCTRNLLTSIPSFPFVFMEVYGKLKKAIMCDLQYHIYSQFFTFFWRKQNNQLVPWEHGSAISLQHGTLDGFPFVTRSLRMGCLWFWVPPWFCGGPWSCTENWMTLPSFLIRSAMQLS